MDVKLSESEVRSLQGLSNIYLLQPPISEVHAKHLLELGFVMQKLGGWVVTVKGRVYLNHLRS